MPDVKQVLFEKAKLYNERLCEFIEDEELSTMYASRANAVEDIIYELGLAEEYLKTYRKDGK